MSSNYNEVIKYRFMRPRYRFLADEFDLDNKYSVFCALLISCVTLSVIFIGLQTMQTNYLD